LSYFYRDLTPAEADARVSPAVRAAAARAIPMLIEDLRLQDLSITWFEPAPAGAPKAWAYEIPVLGLCCPIDTAVQIAVMADPERTIRVIAHEARHRHQYEHGGVPTRKSDRTVAIEAWQERDAEAYEAAFATRFFGGSARPIRNRNFGGHELDPQLKADVAALELMLR
jgi:hypothetical protein